MKVMHNPPIDVRVKVEKYLEKNGKELVNFAYGSNDMDERRFYVGIAYMPTNCDTKKDVDVYSPNRYDVFCYDSKRGEISYYGCKNCTYANALIEMGDCINR